MALIGDATDRYTTIYITVVIHVLPKDPLGRVGRERAGGYQFDPARSSAGSRPREGRATGAEGGLGISYGPRDKMPIKFSGIGRGGGLGTGTETPPGYDRWS